MQRFLVHPKAFDKQSLLDNTVVLLFQLHQRLERLERKLDRVLKLNKEQAKRMKKYRKTMKKQKERIEELDPPPTYPRRRVVCLPETDDEM